MKTTLLLAFTFVLGNLLQAQDAVPNGDFETWIDGTTPASWWTSNVSTIILPITQSTDAHSGSFAVRAEVLDVGSPSITALTQIGSPGIIPITEQPNSLVGWYQFSPVGPTNRLAIFTSLYDENDVLSGHGRVDIEDAQVGSYIQIVIPIDYESNIGGTPTQANVNVELQYEDDNAAIGAWFLVDDLEFSQMITSVEELEGVENSFSLGIPYPSPFASITTIPVEMLEPSNVRAEVYNLIGQRVEVLLDENLTVGSHTLTWEPTSDAASGLYFIRVTSDEGVLTRRLVLQR